MENITQRELAAKYGIARSFLCDILSGKKRPSAKLAVEMELSSGIGRMMWLYADVRQLRYNIEKTTGKKINFKKGRPSLRESK